MRKTMRKLTQKKRGNKGSKGSKGNKRKDKWGKGGTKKKQLNCHPSLAKGKTVVADSCLTLTVLEKIKSTYNQKHPQHRLLANEPKALYHEISQRFEESCKEEKCWIRNLLQVDGKTLENQLYRPTSPADWNKNPVEWLSNIDIEAVMNQYEEAYPEFEFLGPVPIDFDDRTKKGDDTTCVSRDVCSFHLVEKVRKGKTKVGIVFNLSPSTSSGSHWVSLYVHLPDSLMKSRSKSSAETVKGGFLDMGLVLGGLSEDTTTEEGEIEEGGGKGQPWNKETAYCFFFDSAGEEEPKEVAKLVARLQKEWRTNKTLNPHGKPMYYDCNARTDGNHQKGNTECGVYSLFFLTTMLSGKCAGGVVENGEWKETEVCSAPLQEEQEKIRYFQGLVEKGGNRLLIPDAFMVQLRKYYFNPHP